MIPAAYNGEFLSALPTQIKSSVKYEITEDEFLQLYYSDLRLAVLMDMDVIRLIDNHLVVNLRQFITPKTRHLTTFARKNLSACCIGVQTTVEDHLLKQKQKKPTIVCTLDIVLNSSDFLENGIPEEGNQSAEEQKRESIKIGDEMNRIYGIINSLPSSFSGSLKALMKMKGFTEELLEEASGISLSTIKQYRQNEGKTKTLKTVSALCIGMGLHPWITECLVAKAGIIPKASDPDGAYRFLYTHHYKDGIKECNIFLHERGLPEFKDNE